MKTFLLLLALSLVASDKLDRTYLPPPGAKFSGGVPGDIQVPFEFPKESYSTTVRPQLSDDGALTPEDTRIEVGINRGLPSKRPTGSNILTPSSKAPFDYTQSTYNIPTTTTSYAFTQTTTHAPTEGYETTLSPINVATGFPTGSPFNDFQTTASGFPNYQPNYQGQPQQNIPDYQSNLEGQSNFLPISGTSQYQRLDPNNIPSTQIIDENRPDSLNQYQTKNQRPDFTSDLGSSKPKSVSQTSGKQFTQYQGNQFPIIPGIEQSTTLSPSTSLQGSIPSTIQISSNYGSDRGITSQDSSGSFPENIPNVGQPGQFINTSGIISTALNGSQPNTIDQQLPQSFQPGQISDVLQYNTDNVFLPSQFPGSTVSSSDINIYRPSPTSPVPNFSTFPSTSSGSFATNIFPTGASPSSYPGVGSQKTIKPGLTTRPERPQAESDRNAVILNYENVITPEGFAYSFDTSNGIHAHESGTATDGVIAKGGYSYIGDDGKVYSIVYTADENGFQPRGDHLPTPPPIPEAIQKVIEQASKDKVAGVSDDGTYDESKYGHKKYQDMRNRPQNKQFILEKDMIPETYGDQLSDRDQYKLHDGNRRPVSSDKDELDNYDKVIYQDKYEDSDLSTRRPVVNHSTKRPINRILDQGYNKTSSANVDKTRVPFSQKKFRRPIASATPTTTSRVDDITTNSRFIENQKPFPGKKSDSPPGRYQSKLEGSPLGEQKAFDSSNHLINEVISNLPTYETPDDASYPDYRNENQPLKSEKDISDRYSDFPERIVMTSAVEYDKISNDQDRHRPETSSIYIPQTQYDRTYNRYNQYRGRPQTTSTPETLYNRFEGRPQISTTYAPQLQNNRVDERYNENRDRPQAPVIFEPQYNEGESIIDQERRKPQTFLTSTSTPQLQFDQTDDKYKQYRGRPQTSTTSKPQYEREDDTLEQGRDRFQSPVTFVPQTQYDETDDKYNQYRDKLQMSTTSEPQYVQNEDSYEQYTGRPQIPSTSVPQLQYDQTNNNEYRGRPQISMISETQYDHVENSLNQDHRRPQASETISEEEYEQINGKYNQYHGRPSTSSTPGPQYDQVEDKLNQDRFRPQTSTTLASKPKTDQADNTYQISKFPSGSYDQKDDRPQSSTFTTQYDRVDEFNKNRDFNEKRPIFGQSPSEGNKYATIMSDKETGYQYIPPLRKFEQEAQYPKDKSTMDFVRKPTVETTYFENKNVAKPFTTPDVTRSEETSEEEYVTPTGFRQDTIRIRPTSDSNQKEYEIYNKKPGQLFGEKVNITRIGNQAMQVIVDSTGRPFNKPSQGTLRPEQQYNQQFEPNGIEYESSQRIPTDDFKSYQKENAKYVTDNDRTKSFKIPSSPIPSQGTHIEGTEFTSQRPEQERTNVYTTDNDNTDYSTEYTTKTPQIPGRFKTTMAQSTYQQFPTTSYPSTYRPMITISSKSPYNLPENINQSNIASIRPGYYPPNEIPSTTKRPPSSAIDSKDAYKQDIFGRPQQSFAQRFGNYTRFRPGYSEDETVETFYSSDDGTKSSIAQFAGEAVNNGKGVTPGLNKSGRPSGLISLQENVPTSRPLEVSSSTEKIIGEDFSGPKQPQRFDPEHGYYY